MKNIALYEAGDIFTKYVDYFYHARLEAKAEGDAVHDHLYKIFLNSLYGKFGQKNIVWERVGDADPEIIEVETIYQADLHRRVTLKTFGGGVFMENTDENDLEAYNSFPAIAAHVTAYARMLLWNYIELAGREHVHYCDTDSLFVDGWGYQRLWAMDAIDSKRLGALKLEEIKVNGKKEPGIARDLNLFGCKDYFYGGVAKIKGVSKLAKQLPDSKDGKLRFAVPQWGGLSERLRVGDLQHYYNKVIIKTLKREYDKGTIDGNRITPFHLDVVAEEAAQREIALAQAQAAAASGDTIKELCLLHGYIRTPKRGQRHYTEYMEDIPQKNKGRYFRLDKGLTIDVWAATCGYEVSTLMEELKRT